MDCQLRLLLPVGDINVLGVDINEEVINTINDGRVHIIEPALDSLVKYVVDKGLLKASTLPVNADVF